MNSGNAICTVLVPLGLLAPLLSAQRETRPPAASPTIGACPVFPPDNIWNTPVDRLPPDPNSAGYVEAIGAAKPLHPDFGAGLYQGAPIGIPFVLIPGNQKRLRIQFEYRDESDLSNYPIPPNAPIEGGPQSKGDRHVLLVDRDNCVLWEIYAAVPQPDGSWRGGSGAIFDLKCNSLRPDGWTSADAAGLPILPGLVRYEEVAAGEIRHALRFTVARSRKAYVWPAQHAASPLTDPRLPAMGQRFRLKADFDISGYSPHARVILTALKKYGMMVADNGSPWFISGVPDERWNNDILAEIKKVKGVNFEAVDAFGLFVSHHSGRARGVR